MLIIIIYCQELSGLRVLFILWSLEWWCRHQLSATDSEEMMCLGALSCFPFYHLSLGSLNPFSLDIFSAWQLCV